MLRNADAVVHAAIAPHDADQHDLKALEAVRDAALDGRVRRVLYTSSLWVYGDTGDQVVDESTPLNPVQHVKWRSAHEEFALDLVDHEVDVVVFRPGIVYGGFGGIVGAMFAMARDHGEVKWPGQGDNAWTLVHRDDVAEAYRLALEYARGGERYILTDESAASARQVAEAVARAANVPARSWDRAEVVAQLGAFGEALMTTTRASSARARRELGWTPRHRQFLDEVDSLWREWKDSTQPVS
jgi:nucleoside-diphosphate-sugar epimerase